MIFGQSALISNEQLPGSIETSTRVADVTELSSALPAINVKLLLLDASDAYGSVVERAQMVVE
jgi:hypothetical protein